MFLKNSWYAAAWSSEVGDNLLTRQIIGMQVLLYRKRDGTPVAMLDRCPHRFAPLSGGRKLGDDVRCPYHGLTWSPEGRCVANPVYSKTVPEAARVPTWPVVERHRLLWVWPGDPAKADPARIPDLSLVATTQTEPFSEGYIHVRADYRLVVDNLMDLSHSMFLHEETIAPFTPALLDGDLRVSRRGDRIKAAIEMKGVDFGDGALHDQWLETEWSAPGVVELTLAQASAGQPRPNDAVRAMHVITAETESSSHYFFGSLTDGRELLVRDPFVDEDEPMLAAVQARMGGEDFWSLEPVVLPNDAAAIQVRRQLEKMIRAEQPT